MRLIRGLAQVEANIAHFCSGASDRVPLLFSEIWHSAPPESIFPALHGNALQGVASPAFRGDEAEDWQL
jgi:hypothetical protein